ncbi:hypothetical protein VW746_005383 [Escherichia coli]|nr:hypothetical protein [Escherichia coli]
MPELSFADAPYRRCIPSLTETAARQGDSSARVCGENQKRYAPGFTALTERGVVPHGRWFGAMVEETGRCVTSQDLLCHVSDL